MSNILEVPQQQAILALTAKGWSVRTYEPTRNILASKQNKVGTTVISQYDYTVNALGQRTNVSQVGTAFQAVRSIAWGYDTLGQVTSADSSVNTHDRTYQYDTIGNRLQSGEGVSPAAITNYTANALNQYSSITNPQSTILNPIHDADGNATAYPLPASLTANSALTWDAENRLISTTVSGVTTTYQYDSHSRRITKNTGGTNTVYVYDGWNPIAEYVGSALTKSYTWGIDLSGSMQGAGGVGGLLAVAIHNHQSTIYYPLYDGNGNVSEYLDSTGAFTAHFEYDPFGRTLVDTDSSGLFAHRFSTKPIDTQTGLYYYGYRYYDPNTGRWPSRDPIQEKGGINLYGFVGNSSISRIDPLGLAYGGGGNADFNEKFACWWDCGVEKSKKAAALAGQALAETQDRFPGMTLHNDKADAWRHCFWSCEMARAIGQQCAKDIGDNHENAGNRKGQPKNEREMDEHNNAAGRGFGSQFGNCADLCQKALDDGKLKFITP